MDCQAPSSLFQHAMDQVAYGWNDEKTVTQKMEDYDKQMFQEMLPYDDEV